MPAWFNLDRVKSNGKLKVAGSTHSKFSILIAKSKLFLPYTSSIILTETLQEILSDKIRALYERQYLKGRDIYDIWWIVNQMFEEKSTLKRLKLLPKLFRKQDAEKIAPHTGMFLTRALKKNLIHRINRGNYINSFFVCTAATLSSSVGKSREIEYQGITIEFSKISPKLFFGYETHQEFYMATPEKALIDTLYYRGNLPVADELELEGLNRGTLIEMAKKFGCGSFETT